MVFQLPTAAEPAITDFSGFPIVLVVANSKVGKSSLAATFPDPIFFDFENGLSSITTHKARVKTRDELAEAIKAMKSPEGKKFKTVVIDTFDFAINMFEMELLSRAKVEILRKYGSYGEGYDVVRSKMRGVIISLRDLEQQVVILCHSAKKTLRPKNGEPYDITTLAIRDDVTAEFLKSNSDIILYMEKGVTEDGKDYRAILTNPNICDGMGSRPLFTGEPIVAFGNERLHYNQLLADFNKANKE